MKTTSRTNKILAAAVTGMAIASANGAFAASEQTVSGPARPIYSALETPDGPLRTPVCRLRGSGRRIPRGQERRLPMDDGWAGWVVRCAWGKKQP